MSDRSSQRPHGTTALAHLGVMAAVAAVMGVLVAGLVIPFAGVVGVASSDVAKSMDNLPAELEATPLAQKTSILDADGNLIASLYDENRVNVSLDQVSRKMVQSIVSIEDYRFYNHGALDLRGTIRALVTNQASDGVVQGGSSITQQMVKMTLIDQAGRNKEAAAAAQEDTYARKVRELRYAIAFEKNYSKDWILERYLNIAYFGDGAYGIQAAARHYFGKNAKNLKLDEAALLAGVVKNPTLYDPTNYPEKAVARRNVVLDRMAQLNVITADKAAKTKAKGLGLDITRSPNGCVQSQAPFFCDYVVNYLEQDESLGKTVTARRRLLKSGGLTIRTTIDLNFQKAADDAVQGHVYPTDEAIGGLAMVEPRTGNVKALAQSRPMGGKKKKGETYLNFVVPEKYGDAKGFQAGSTFKVFVLASAINQGIPLSKTISSPERISIPQNQFETCDGMYPISSPWELGNSTDSGTFDLYSGTRLSVNTFYAQLEMETGLCEPYALAKSMGIELTDPGSERVPSFTLGVANTSPLEMAEAYATFAGRGLHCSSRPVTAIEDANGALLKSYPEACKQVLPGAVADAVSSVLRGVMEPGGFGQNLAIDKPSAGKTGTINDNKAVWFVGYTPTVATAAMVAGANYQGYPITLNGQTLGGGYVASAFGSTVAGPLWGEAMGDVAASLPYEDFNTPPGDEIAGVLSSVPEVGGMTVEAATAAIEAAGFVAGNGGYVNSSVAKDSVAYSSPGVGTELSSGDTVVIYQSTGYVPPPAKDPKKKKKKGRG